MTEIWASILKQIEPKLDPKELKTWFGPTRQLELAASTNGPVLTVSVPSRVFADWIQSRHGELLAECSRRRSRPGRGLALRESKRRAPPMEQTSCRPDLPE